MSQSSDAPDLVIVYDGECPFCSRYVKMLRLKQASGTIALINARDGGPYVQQVVDQGLDLDEGMALLYGGRWYHGADCLFMLAMLTSPVDGFNTLTAAIFRSPRRAKLLYPFLRAGRNATLCLLGRHKLNSTHTTTS